jgi:hypothetical protein
MVYSMHIAIAFDEHLSNATIRSSVSSWLAVLRTDQDTQQQMSFSELLRIHGRLALDGRHASADERLTGCRHGKVGTGDARAFNEL